MKDKIEKDVQYEKGSTSEIRNNLVKIYNLVEVK